MIQLRPYQLQAINDLREGFKTHKRQILALTTGGGKTLIFTSIVVNAALKNKTVLVLSDRLELFIQSFKSISKHNIPICKINAENKRIDSQAKIFIGMVESFKRRIKLFQDIQIDLIILDECHKQTFNKVMDAFPNTKVIGCSATPVSKTIHKYYTNIVQPIDTLELIEQGYLVPCKAFQMQADLKELQIDTSGEFTYDSLASAFQKTKLYEGVIDKYMEKCHNTKTVIFNCNISHTLEMTKAFNSIGIRSFAVTSETPKSERDFILAEFERGAFLVLNNCGILVAGWDCPSVETVILNRATNSITMFLQMIGRGSRTYPGKLFFNVIDFGENHTRNQLWMQNRQWTLDPPKKKNKKTGAAPVRECKSCGAMLPAQQKKCNFCGFEISDKDVELLQGQLVEVKAPEIPKLRGELVGRNVSECSIPELIELETAKVINSVFAWRVLRSRGEADIIEYANAKKYRAGWIQRQISDMDSELAEVGKIGFNDFKIRPK